MLTQAPSDPYLDALLERSVHAHEMSNTILQSSMSTRGSLSSLCLRLTPPWKCALLACHRESKTLGMRGQHGLMTSRRSHGMLRACSAKGAARDQEETVKPGRKPALVRVFLARARFLHAEEALPCICARRQILDSIMPHRIVPI